VVKFGGAWKIALAIDGVEEIHLKHAAPSKKLKL
jgi:hypothetical protein